MQKTMQNKYAKAVLWEREVEGLIKICERSFNTAGSIN